MDLCPGQVPHPRKWGVAAESRDLCICLDVDEAKRLELRGYVACPRLIRASKLGRMGERPPDLTKRSWHIFSHAKAVAFLDEHNSPRGQGAHQAFEDLVPLRDVQKHESCVYKVELTFGKASGDKINLSYLPAPVGEIIEVACVGVYRDDSTARQGCLTEPSGEGSAARACFQAPSSRPNAQP